MGGIRGHGGGGSPRCSAWARPHWPWCVTLLNALPGDGGSTAGTSRDGDKVHGTPAVPPEDAGTGRRLGLHPHPVQRRRGQRRGHRSGSRGCSAKQPAAADPAHHGLGRGQPRARQGAVRLRGHGPAHRLHPCLRRHPGRHPVLRPGLDEGRQARRRQHRLEPGRPGDRPGARALRRLRRARRDRRQALPGRTPLHRLERVQGLLERRRGPLGLRGLHRAVQPRLQGAEEGRQGHHGRRPVPGAWTASTRARRRTRRRR